MSDKTDEPEAWLAPIAPPPEVRVEIESLLAQDDSRLGDVFRGIKHGASAEEIATSLDVGTSNFVWNNARMIKALTEGDLPTAPSVATMTARKFRAFLAGQNLSLLARKVLETNLAELERRAQDERAIGDEVRAAVKETEQAESRNEIGIYAYALPHYLLHPYDPKSGRTLMKVGRSDSDVIQRFRAQTRTTALPEEPLLLRIYRVPVGETPEVEQKFHRVLVAADHDRSVARTAGREWFVTSTRFLDEVAGLMGLEVAFRGSTEVLDD